MSGGLRNRDRSDAIEYSSSTSIIGLVPRNVRFNRQAGTGQMLQGTVVGDERPIGRQRDARAYEARRAKRSAPFVDFDVSGDPEQRRVTEKAARRWQDRGSPGRAQESSHRAWP